MNFIAWYLIIGLVLIGLAAGNHAAKCPNDPAFTTNIPAMLLVAMIWPAPIAAGIAEYWSGNAAPLKCRIDNASEF